MSKVAFCVLLSLLPLGAATPCTSANSSCTEWINLGGSSRSMVYRNYPLDTRNQQITRALVMIHGSGRDADRNFSTSLAAAFLANALEDTIVVAPRIASGGRGCGDTLAEGEVSYSCTGDSWRSGGTALNDSKVTSFDFIDNLLRKLARKEIFPNLRQIVVAGHSAGGQFVNRYEMANQVHDTLGVAVTYVVSNSSSYAYLDEMRPNARDWPVSAGLPGYVVATPGQEDGAPAGAGFRAFRDAINCTTYNLWPFGLQHRSGYTARLTDDQLKKQLAARPVTYMFGELDVLPVGGFDSSCPAMAQGPTRLARGLAFNKRVNEAFGAHHTAIVIPLCGHNSRCIFTADPALPVLFPK